ncbi:MAG: hypothetical protein VXY90_14010 [Pseudomonadota bacterium]|nr:hypothetical protein [Pseudomonadota bacterium]
MALRHGRMLNRPPLPAPAAVSVREPAAPQAPTPRTPAPSGPGPASPASTQASTPAEAVVVVATAVVVGAAVVGPRSGRWTVERAAEFTPHNIPSVLSGVSRARLIASFGSEFRVRRRFV